MTRTDVIGSVGVTAFAFALRFWHLVSLRESPFFNALIGDARGYHHWGLEIAGGEWLGSEIFFQAPLYPYFLGIVTVGLLAMYLARLRSGDFGEARTSMEKAIRLGPAIRSCRPRGRGSDARLARFPRRPYAQ